MKRAPRGVGGGEGRGLEGGGGSLGGEGGGLWVVGGRGTGEEVEMELLAI